LRQISVFVLIVVVVVSLPFGNAFASFFVVRSTPVPFFLTPGAVLRGDGWLLNNAATTNVV